VSGLTGLYPPPTYLRLLPKRIMVHSIVVGDDLRAFSGVDLSQFSDIELVRNRIDDLVASFGTRLSTLEVDTERSGLANDAGPEIAVSCDNITTSATGGSIIIGDILTIIGRTYLADAVDSAVLEQMTEDVLNRLHDIELVLVDLHVALYELHHNLLVRAIGSSTPNPSLAEKLHSLSLGDDKIQSFGGDVIVGDSG